MQIIDLSKYLISVYSNLITIAIQTLIVLFLLPYYLLATTGFVNDQVMSAGQSNPQEEAAIKSI